MQYLKDEVRNNIIEETLKGKEDGAEVRKLILNIIGVFLNVIFCDEREPKFIVKESRGSI
jgi:hypothetical protein